MKKEERKKHFKNLVVEVPISFYKKVDDAAYKERTTKSDLIRRAINDYLENER